MSGGYGEDGGAYQGPVEPHRGTLVVVLGILSLVVFSPLGIAAWVIGGRDLRAMRAGRMDRTGESATNIGYVLGIIGTVLYGETGDGPWFFDLLQQGADTDPLRDLLIFGQNFDGSSHLDAYGGRCSISG